MKASLKMIGNFAFVLLVLTILFSYAMFQGGFVSWFLFYSFLPILLYHFGLLLYPIKKWKVSRKLNRHVIRAGDEIEVTIKIERSFPFPLFYCFFEEIFPVTLNKVDSRQEKYYDMDKPSKFKVNRKIKKVIFPAFKREIDMTYKIMQIPRGEHRLQGIQVRTGDLFGFVKKEYVFPVNDELVAYPNVRPVQILEKVSSFEQGSIASPVLNLKNTNVATGVREYAPGDRFSWIDWKQTARKNTVMTKEFEVEKNRSMLLLLDSCYYKGMNPLAFEASIEVTHSIMEGIRKEGAQIGLISIGEKVAHFPINDSLTSNLVKRHLARLQPSGDRPFALKVKEEMLQMDRGDIGIILTTHLDDFFKQIVLQMSRRISQVAVIFIKPSTLISQNEQHIIRQLQFSTIGIQVLTEKQLVKNKVEVSLR